MGGYKYKDDERASLLELIKDNPDIGDTELARKAHRYGVCKGRTENALKQYIAKLKMPEAENEDSGTTLIYDNRAILEADRDACREAADGLIDALIGHAALYDGGSFYGLKYDMRYVNKYLKTHYNDLVADRIDELIEEKNNAK